MRIRFTERVAGLSTLYREGQVVTVGPVFGPETVTETWAEQLVAAGVAEETADDPSEPAPVPVVEPALVPVAEPASVAEPEVL